METIDVLDLGYVKLVEHWGSDERIIEAARMSTGKGFQGWGRYGCKECDVSWDTYFAYCNRCHKPATKVNDGDEKLLAYLWNNKHHTPFEMAGLIIEVKAPIFVFREWHRHRTQSYNEMSARYIPLPDQNYLPDVQNILQRIATNSENKQSAQTNKYLPNDNQVQEWLSHLETLYFKAQDVYNEGLNLGIPKELARLPVPVARYSVMRASANLRNWLVFLTLRMAPNAQWEIRQYANAVHRILGLHFPRICSLFNGDNVYAGSK